MDDNQIIQLYHARSESAIQETESKYGRYCHSVAYGILHDSQDADECVNDTYLRAWNAMPPKWPRCLRTFLGKITRNVSLDLWDKRSAEKRGNSQVQMVLDELLECIPSETMDDKITDDLIIRDTINRFLADIPAESRKIFVKRYWYMCSIKDIAEELYLTESNVKIILYRTRNLLKEYLAKEGVSI